MRNNALPKQPPDSAETTNKPATVDTAMYAEGLVMMTDPNDPSAEGIRALRTHLLAQHLQLGRRALAVCSANLGVGKTFVAANLAVSFAQVGVKTALIDADMRTTGIQRYFPPAGTPNSLAYFLQNETAIFGDAITSDVCPNLSVIYSGSSVSNPQELLGSVRFKELIDFCLRDYDLTIVDTPAAQLSADSRRVSTLVGYSLIVAGKNSTRVSDIRSLLDQIVGDQGKAIGTVLNYA